MNEIFGQRLSRTMMFHQLMRTHGTLWAATQVTKEKLDYKFIEEEFMRVNGRRTMPLLVRSASKQNLHETHLAHLSDNYSWCESKRAYIVRNQTPITQRVAAMGRMADTIQNTKTNCASQLVVSEHLSRIEGISAFEEEPTADS